jgi:hypothetical protein
MVLTKNELNSALQHEVRILTHLATKIDPAAVDYRPTPKQRSTLELLQYLTIMGPQLIEGTKNGKFDVDKWTAAQQEASSRNFDQTVAALQKQIDIYPALLADMSDADFRREIEMFGQKTTVGACIVNLVLGGHAAYRTQLFCYLKACGREELSTMNLWAGMDTPAPAPA